MKKRALAVGAHPDDIEFMMAGTLARLGGVGYELHYLNVANGSCGSMTAGPKATAEMRRREAQEAATLVGAVFHESLVNDIEIFYERDLLQRVAAVVREVAPDVILTHGPNEYMEDHSITARLVVTAAFTRGMPNFPVQPPAAAVSKGVALYHALPYGLRDPLNRPVVADLYVDVADVFQLKRDMLACHKSQKEWLDKTQSLDSYLDTLGRMTAEMGCQSGTFDLAEGWTRHLPLGLGDDDDDPLVQLLGGSPPIV